MYYFNSENSGLAEPTALAEISAQEGIKFPPISMPGLEPAVQFQISKFKSCRDVVPRQESITWDDFISQFGTHAQRVEKDGPAWSPASYFEGKKRGNENVELMFFAVIDVDDGTPCDEVMKKFDGFSYLVHSSYSHSVAKAKYRMVLPLDTPVRVSDWHSIWQRINLMAGGCNDAATKDPARLYYMPAHPVGDTANFVHVGAGRFLALEDLPSLPESTKGNVVLFRSTASLVQLPEIEGIEGCGPDLNFAQGLKHVVERCAFMQFASAPENQDDLYEPLWMAMISNACRFEESEGWIHDASSKHSGYDKDQTGARIGRYRNVPAPITCQRIRDLGFQGCPSGGCARPNGVAVRAPAALGTWMFRRQLTAAEVHIDNVPETYPVDGGFIVKPQGVYQVIKNKKDDGEEQVRLCSRIDVTARTRDQDSSNWGAELRFTDPDGVKKTWALPMELLASTGESYRASLLKMGALIEPSKRARDGLAAYLTAAQPDGRAISVRQPGWSRSLFVLPDAVYGRSDERLVFQTTDPDDMKRFSRAGSLESWQQYVAVPSQGNSRAVISICIGLAPPLLSLLGEDNGGFHLRGNSSSGKTVCLGIGASVWGGTSLIRTWNMTTNGFEGVAAMHNDVLLPLDELGQADGRAAGEAAYMLGNGQGKSRSTRDGDARAVKRFRNLVLSSGEKSLSDLMTQAGPPLAGQNPPPLAGSKSPTS